jgi:ABC-2 type transport system ATP-binding protein
MFDLNTGAKIKTLSTGQTARVGLVTALAHRPELLILDEPSSGLDPVVRRDILEAIIESISKAGSTVVFSSHLLDEVERVSDYIAMMKSGRILECGSFESLKNSYRVVTLSFEEGQPRPPACPPAINWRGGGREWTAVCRSLPDDLTAEVTMIGGRRTFDSRRFESPSQLNACSQLSRRSSGNSRGVTSRRSRHALFHSY